MSFLNEMMDVKFHGFLDPYRQSTLGLFNEDNVTTPEKTLLVILSLSSLVGCWATILGLIATLGVEFILEFAVGTRSVRSNCQAFHGVTTSRFVLVRLDPSSFALNSFAY